MKMISRLIIFAALVCAFQLVFISLPSADLIEPTRGIGEKVEEMSRLTVLSEPPGLKVVLDGEKLGKTPKFLMEVKPGLHNLKIKDSETEFYVAPGKTLKISLFKNEFVQVPVEVKTPEEEPEPEQKIEAPTPESAKMSPTEKRIQENKKQAKDRWMRYIDGSLPSF
jgi:hypothetical protein